MAVWQVPRQWTGGGARAMSAVPRLARARFDASACARGCCVVPRSACHNVRGTGGWHTLARPTTPREPFGLLNWRRSYEKAVEPRRYRHARLARLPGSRLLGRRVRRHHRAGRARALRAAPRIVPGLPGTPRPLPGRPRRLHGPGAPGRRPHGHPSRVGPVPCAGTAPRGAVSGQCDHRGAGRSLFPRGRRPPRPARPTRRLRGAGGHRPGGHGRRSEGVRAGLASPGGDQGAGRGRGRQRHGPAALHPRSPGRRRRLPRPCRHRPRRPRSRTACPTW